MISAVSRSQFIPIKQEKKDITLSVLQALRQSRPFGFDLNALSPNEINQILEKVAVHLNGREIDRLAGEISLGSLEKAVRVKYPDHVSALETARAMLEESKYYLASASCQIEPTLKTRIESILDSLLSVLESFLNGLGIADFFRKPENRIDADFKTQKLMALLGMFTTVTAILVPILGPVLGAKILGGFFLTVAGLSLIYPHIKPRASQLPRGENWTKRFQMGELLVADGRKKTLDEMARILIGGKQAKIHVMLIGKTGIGKTETAKAFVKAIERGDYPELKGKQVIYFNTADLLGGTEMFSTANKIFSQISEAMGRHRDDFILIFDEIHMACHANEQGRLSEQLKTLLDPGKNKFPFCIGITTEREFVRDIYVNNPAFARRFKRLPIENTDDEETLKILKNAMIQEAPKTLVDPNALPILLAKTKEAFGQGVPQPASALKILSQCIKRTTSTQPTLLEAKVEEVRRRMQSLYAEGSGRLPYGRPAPQLETTLKHLETELAKEKRKFQELSRNQDRFAELKETMLRKVVNRPKEKRALNAFSLESHYQIPALEDKIRREAAVLNLKVAITPQLVDEVIQEELANEKRVKEMLLKA